MQRNRQPNPHRIHIRSPVPTILIPRFPGMRILKRHPISNLTLRINSLGRFDIHNQLVLSLPQMLPHLKLVFHKSVVCIPHKFLVQIYLTISINPLEYQCHLLIRLQLQIYRYVCLEYHRTVRYRPQTLQILAEEWVGYLVVLL